MAIDPVQQGLPAWLSAQAISGGDPRTASVAQRITAALDAAGLTSGGGGGAGGSATRAAAQARLAEAAAGTRGAAPIAVRGAASPTVARAAAQATSAPSFIARAGAGGLGAGGAAAPGTGAAGVLAQAAPAITGGSRLAGLLAPGNSAPTWLTARLGGQSTAGLGMRSLAPGSLGRAGLYGAAGYLGGQGIEAITGHQEGTLDDALRNATVGAGMGAGLGSIIPGLGTAIGAGLGFAGGGLHGLLTGKGSDEGERDRAYEKQAEKFETLFTTYGVSPELRDQFMTQFGVTTEGLKRGEVNEVAKQMREILPSLIAEDAAMQEEERGRTAMLAAAQGWMAPMLRDAMGRSTRYADQLSQSMVSSAGYIKDPAQRAFAMDDAKRITLDNASQQAYAMQMMMSLPGLYGYNTKQGENGVPATDFTSILNATPIAQPNGQTMPFSSMFGQPQPMQ